MLNLGDIKGVGAKTLEKLNSLGIYTVTDLVENLPSSYLDMTKISTSEDIVEGVPLLLKLNITKVYPMQYSKNKVSYIKCDSLCDDLSINLIWFNMPHMKYTLECGEFLVWGIVNYNNKKWTMVNPNIADVENKYKLKDLKPNYSLKGKIPEVNYRKIIDNALCECSIPNMFGELFNLNKVFRDIHFAKSVEQMQNAQRTLAIYEIAVQLFCYKAARNLYYTKPIEVEYPRYVEEILPYSLTKSQKQAINDIISDFAEEHPMNRFILGDVGSGKTIVAHLAINMIAQKGYQCVMLAPTEILAYQHFDNYIKVFKNFGLNVALLTSSTPKEEREILLHNLEIGKINVLFSTHSCVEDSVKFANLKLAVIDEAHKFGVKQKSNLLLKGDGVHCLSMSATPLPRTFAMIVFGDLKISKLFKAEGRENNVKTYILRSNKIDDMFSYFAKKVKSGSQIFVVCPRVVENESADLYSVKSVYKMLSKKFFDKAEISMLYGGMKSVDKQKAILDFAEGKTKVLVSTTVIEVGIDIKSVDTIAILAADAFGIATLHQLRGRVGRDGRQSECYLHTMCYKIPERIKNMKNCNDGVLLSEMDAKLRGYGDFIGFSQSGKNDFSKYAVIITEEMIAQAKQIADNVNNDDIPHSLLQKYMIKYDFYKDIILN